MKNDAHFETKNGRQNNFTWAKQVKALHEILLRDVSIIFDEIHQHHVSVIARLATHFSKLVVPNSLIVVSESSFGNSHHVDSLEANVLLNVWNGPRQSQLLSRIVVLGGCDHHKENYLRLKQKSL